MDFFFKYKTIIFRVLGTFILLVGFVIHFWVNPKEGISKSQIAAMNVARMEASAKGRGSSSAKSSKPDTSRFLEELKNTKEKQKEYFSILVMVLGSGFLGYSFLRRD